jgi:hypothetical protein
MGRRIIILGLLFSFIALLAPVAIFLYLDNRTPPWKKAVLDGGQGAWGEVRKIEGSGFAKNNMPDLRLAREVRPPGEAPFEAKFERPEFQAAGLSPGASVYVNYDPQNKQHITIADSPAGAAPARHSKHQPPTPPPDLAGQLGRLAKRREAGQLTAEEFEAAKRKLLG